MIKKLNVIILLFVLITFLFGCSKNTEMPKSEYDITYYATDDFTPKIKVPPNTFHIQDNGLLVMIFETTSTKDEINRFYNDYFSTLEVVYRKNTSYSDDTEYYYDDKQKIVVYGLEISEDADKNTFYITIDQCSNIETSDVWTTKKPY